MILYSLIESSSHPNFSSLYRELEIDEIKITSGRKAISRLKKQPPDYIVAEFFYGYANNYAGINISNLDVLLYSLQKYAPKCRLVVLVSPAERPYVDKLNEIFPLHAVLVQPVAAEQMRQVLQPAS